MAGFFGLGLGGVLWASRPLWLVFFGFARAIYRQTWLLLREPAALTLACHEVRVKQAAAAGRVLGEEIWGVEIVNGVDSATYGKSSHSVHRPRGAPADGPSGRPTPGIGPLESGPLSLDSPADFRL